MKLTPSGLDTQRQREAYQTELFQQFLEKLNVEEARALLGKLNIQFQATVRKAEELRLQGRDKTITDQRIEGMSSQLIRVRSMLGGNDSVCGEHSLHRMPLLSCLSFVTAELLSLNYTLDATTRAEAEQVEA